MLQVLCASIILQTDAHDRTLPDLTHCVMKNLDLIRPTQTDQTQPVDGPNSGFADGYGPVSCYLTVHGK